MKSNPGPQPTLITEDEQLPTVIQGIPVGSQEEARVAKALDKLKYDYIYQYSFNGGRLIAGGQVIDFVVYVPPKPVPIYVQGEYWHNLAKSASDALKQQEVAMSGYFAQPVLLWANDLTSVEAAQARLVMEL